jgi:hypothetical protein
VSCVPTRPETENGQLASKTGTISPYFFFFIFFLSISIMDKMRMFILFSLILVSAILLSGCLTNLSGSNKYTKKYSSDLQSVAIYDEGQITECKLGECFCFACENTSRWFGFKRSMAGGHCRWVSACTSNEFYKLANQKDKDYENFGPRPFMIGQGYSFSDFSEANGWCGNRLDMSVQWIIGSNTSNYSDVDPDRATCMLDMDVMPVYVFYSNSTNANPTRIGEVVNILSQGGKGGVGPIVVTTEIDFNKSKQDMLSNISLQIKEINTVCKNERPYVDGKPDHNNTKLYCLVALAPKMGDIESVNSILLDPETNKNVDLIAFGINGNTANLSDNRDRYCDPNLVYEQALAFAKFSLYNHSKPTIIPYILFDSKGTDATGKCNWSEAKMVKGYSTFFKTQLIPLQKAGVIGIAPYDFNASAFALNNPLGCSDCSLGKTKERMAAWFSSCRIYKMVGDNFLGGDNMIVFSNASGGAAACDYNVGGSLFQMQYGRYFNAITPELKPKNDTLFRCDACVSEDVDFPDTTTKVQSVGKDSKYCKDFPAFEHYAGMRNLDPMYMRAIAMSESVGFDPCSAAKVFPDKGIDTGCYDKGYDYVPDPDPGSICKNEESTEKLQNGDPSYRYCALGLMQTLVPPYEFWPYEYYSQHDPDTIFEHGPYYENKLTATEEDQLYRVAKEKDRSGEGYIQDIINECSPKFNPFNASHSICFGTFHFQGNFEIAKGFVTDSVAAELKADTPGKRKMLTYHIAANFYRGGRSKGTIRGWMAEFSAQSDLGSETYLDGLTQADREETLNKIKADPDCYGNPDFVSFVRMCIFKKNKYKVWRDENNIPNNEDHPPYYGDYASKVLGYYLGLTENCQRASCPSWKQVREGACTNDPLSWPPLIGDQCVRKRTTATTTAVTPPTPGSPVTSTGTTVDPSTLTTTPP